MALPAWPLVAFFLRGVVEVLWAILQLPFRRYRELPVLTFQPTDRNKRIVDRCPSLKAFSPCPWAAGPAAQMLVSKLKPVAHETAYRRELLLLSDGVQVALDWKGDGLPDDAPLVVAAHGLGGDSSSTYLRLFTELCLRAKGWRTVVYNRRGHAGVSLTPLVTPLPYDKSSDLLAQAGAKPREGSATAARTTSGNSSGSEPPPGTPTAHAARRASPPSRAASPAAAAASDCTSSSAATTSASTATTTSRSSSPGSDPAEVTSPPSVAAAAGRSTPLTKSPTPSASPPPPPLRAVGTLRRSPTGKIFPKHSDMDDIEDVMQHVGALYPRAPKFMIGYSAGSNLVVQYAATRPHTLQGAVSVSNAHDLSAATKGMVEAAPMSNALVAAFIREKAEERLEDLRVLCEQHGVALDFDTLLKTNCLREFDAAMMMPIYDYASVDEYYEDISCYKNMKDVRIPLMTIGNLDDPVIVPPTLSQFPQAAVQESDAIVSVVTQRGGHLGWQEGWRARPWMHHLSLEFIQAVMDTRAPP